MAKKQIKIVHLRGTNGSQYAHIGVYSGNELPKEYRGVGVIFNANPNTQEITLQTPYTVKTHTRTYMYEDIFRIQPEPQQLTPTDEEEKLS